MGRNAKAKKRKKVLVTPVMRTKDGEPTEPYRILAELIDEFREDLAEAKIEILWRAGWRPDADGWIQMVNVKKAGDVDKALSVKADFAVMLNKERFPKLPSERFKKVYLHHALCHMKPLYDADGEQKQDDQGRKLWRVVKRHDIEQFAEIVKVYGNDCLHLDEEAKAAINDADRPLLKNGLVGCPAGEAGPTGPSGGDEAWASEPIGVLNLPDAVETFIVDAGHKTVGSLSQFMVDHSTWWAKDMQVGGRRKPPRFQDAVEDAFQAFWKKRKAKA